MSPYAAATPGTFARLFRACSNSESISCRLVGPIFGLPWRVRSVRSVRVSCAMRSLHLGGTHTCNRRPHLRLSVAAHGARYRATMIRVTTSRSAAPKPALNPAPSRPAT